MYPQPVYMHAQRAVLVNKGESRRRDEHRLQELCRYRKGSSTLRSDAVLGVVGFNSLEDQLCSLCGGSCSLLCPVSPRSLGRDGQRLAVSVGTMVKIGAGGGKYGVNRRRQRHAGRVVP